MPCDTSSNLYLQQYNEVLSHISTNIHYNNVNHCIVADVLNTDFTRSDSGNTISLTLFINNEIFILYYKIMNTILNIHI